MNATRQGVTKGSMVGDGGPHSNATVKVVVVEGSPHLCLFAIKDIVPGEVIQMKYNGNVVSKQVSLHYIKGYPLFSPFIKMKYFWLTMCCLKKIQ